jgi:hypothetical protein
MAATASLAVNTNGSITLTFTSTPFSDHEGYRLWLSTSAGINLSSAPVFQGDQNPVIYGGLTHGTTYYYRYAEYDVFSSSSSDCAASTEANFVAVNSAILGPPQLSVFDFLNLR